MIIFRDRMARGHTRTGWLDSWHTFSFGDYQDPEHVAFHALRVINEDRVIPGGGFGTHGHRDMEIITYVLSGALQHRDSLGNGTVIRPGEVQRMTAGTGIRHSEFNASPSEPVHFLQIWIIPSATGLAPGYEQKVFDPTARMGKLQLVVAPDGAAGAVTVHQDARLYLANLTPGQEVTHALANGRGAWVQVVRGIATVNGTEVREGDGAAIEAEPDVTLGADTAAEVLLFDLTAPSAGSSAGRS